jgi:hypothetical protein
MLPRFSLVTNLTDFGDLAQQIMASGAYVTSCSFCSSDSYVSVLFHHDAIHYPHIRWRLGVCPYFYGM